MDILKNKFVWVGVAVVVIGGGAFAIHSHNSANKQLTPYTAINGSQRVWYVTETDDGGLNLNSDVDSVLVSKGGKITEYYINAHRSMKDFVGKSDSDVIKYAKAVAIKDIKSQKQDINAAYKRLNSYFNKQDTINYLNTDDPDKHADLKNVADRKETLKKVRDAALKTVDNYSNIKPGIATFEGVSADGNNVTEEKIKWTNSSELYRTPLESVTENGNPNFETGFFLLDNDFNYKANAVTKPFTPKNSSASFEISRQYPSKQLKDQVYAGYVGEFSGTNYSNDTQLLITNVPDMTAKITDANGNPSSATGFDSATQKGIKFETD